MIALYVDEHVPGDIIRQLRLRGRDVLTVQEDGREALDDPLVMERAMELERVLYSQDDDMLAEAHKRQSEGIPFSGVIYIHQLKASLGQRIEALEFLIESYDPDDMQNQVEYLSKYIRAM